MSLPPTMIQHAPRARNNTLISYKQSVLSLKCAPNCHLSSLKLAQLQLQTLLVGNIVNNVHLEFSKRTRVQLSLQFEQGQVEKVTVTKEPFSVANTMTYPIVAHSCCSNTSNSNSIVMDCSNELKISNSSEDSESAPFGDVPLCCDVGIGFISEES